MTAGARGRSLVRGIGSLVLFLAVLIAPPIALAAAVGWPLPTSIPDLDAVDRAVRSGISDEVIVNTLAVIAWMAWAQIALALLVEVGSVVRGRPALHLPVLPGVQVAAARLVAGITMMLSTAHPVAAAMWPAPVVVEHELAAVETPVPVTVVTSINGQAADPPPAPVQPLPTVTVERHDSYWALAERCLGDGLRWRELRDLNVGRTMADGHVIRSGSDLLRPGWVLQLPADAVGAEPPVNPTTVADGGAETPGSEVFVQPGDNLWKISAERLTSNLGRAPTADEIRPHWQQLIELNEDRLAETANPNLIFSGQVLTLPSTLSGMDAVPDAPVPPPPPTPAPEMTPAPPVTSPSTTPPATVDESVPPASTSDPPRDQPAGSHDDEGSSTTPVVVALGGLASVALAVGAKRAIERRRRRFSAANPGHASHRTRERERRLHRQIVANADEDAIDDLRSVMTGLARGMAERGGASRPRIVQHGDHHVDVFLNHPHAEACEGWIADGDGALWTLDSSAAPPFSTDDCAAPLLVTIGQPDDGAQLYIDLEADGLISLAGHPESARGLARSIVTEVALSPLTDTVRVIVVGDLLDIASSSLNHLAVVDSWERAEEDIGAWAEQSHAALVEKAWPNTFIGRGSDPDHDALAPVLVVASGPPPAGLLHAVLVNRPASLAMVVVGEMDEAACVIDCQPDILTVVDLELSCVPQVLGDDTLAAMIRVLETADERADDEAVWRLHPDVEFDDRDEGEERADGDGVVDASDIVDLSDPPIDGGGPAQLFPVPMASDGQGAVPDVVVHEQLGPPEPDYEILVRLLGDIRVEGGKPLRPKPTAVVAYVALHRSVSIESLEDACWADPASGSLRKRLKDVMSECRAALGAQHLPTSSDGRYAVGSGVLTDTELFNLRVARAASEPSARQANTYRSALELVTGKVFTYPSRAGSSFGWIDIENLVSQWEVKIQAVAQQCIETYLAIDAPDQAIEVANHVLLALPLNTAVTEALMCAQAANGDPRAVETIYRAHVEGLRRVLNAEPEESTMDRRRALGLSDRLGT